MNFYQYVKRHLIVVVCLLAIGYGIVAYIEIICPEKINQSAEKDAAVAFEPIYNESGSALHARLGIGYQQGLLIFEAVVALLGIWILYRLIEYYNIFFGIKRFWSYFVDFGAASGFARLSLNLAGRYTLDYVYIRAARRTYDFFDFYIGIFAAGILMWAIPFCMKYYKYKKRHTAGMGFWKKFWWERKFSWQLVKASFRPIRTWWKDIE